jgi:hypothetical protein
MSLFSKGDLSYDSSILTHHFNDCNMTPGPLKPLIVENRREAEDHFLCTQRSFDGRRGCVRVYYR